MQLGELQLFGRYILLDRIAEGGMGEIYRARIATKEGAGRVLVLKIMRSNQYFSNKEMQSMFQKEMQLMLRLSHPSISQVYEYGQVEEIPFIAMEWVDGKDLRKITSAAAKAKEPFPPSLSLHICAEVAKALEFAHTLEDKMTGKKMKVIHRDINPQNILISYEGAVKVIDFGIAKTQDNTDKTRSGMIKGKLAYLTPEQLDGLEIDERCDIFILGTVLWELLTGKRLFANANETTVLANILNCDNYVKPPSKVNANLPLAIDAVVMKALTYDREKRYRSANAFFTSIHKALYKEYSDFNPSDLSGFVRGLFRKQIEIDRENIKKLNIKAEEKISITNQNPATTSPTLSPDKDTTSNRTQRQTKGSHKNIFEFDKELKQAGNLKFEANIPLYENPNLQVPLNSQNTATAPSSRSYSRTPSVKEIKPKSKMSMVLLLLIVAGVFLVISKDQIKPPTKVSPTQEPKQASTATTAGAKTHTMLSLQIYPEGPLRKISLNGTELNSKELSIQIPINQSLELIAERAGYQPNTQMLFISPQNLNPDGNTQIKIDLDPIESGKLKLRSTPTADVIITSDKNETWKLQTPIQHLKLAIGNYSALLTNSNLGFKKSIKFSIKPNLELTLEENLVGN